MQQNHTMTRRSALAITAAAVLASAAVPALADDDRAEWLTLWRDYQQQEARHVAATDAFHEAEHAAERAYPEPPQCLWERIDGEPRRFWHGGIRPASREYIEAFADQQLKLSGSESHANIIAARDSRLAAREAWEADCAAVDARFSVPALRAACETEADRFEALEQAIVAKPATGIIGVAVKLAMWARTELTDTLDCAGGRGHRGRPDLARQSRRRRVA